MEAFVLASLAGSFVATSVALQYDYIGRSCIAGIDVEADVVFGVMVDTCEQSTHRDKGGRCYAHYAVASPTCAERDLQHLQALHVVRVVQRSKDYPSARFHPPAVGISRRDDNACPHDAGLTSR